VSLRAVLLAAGEGTRMRPLTLRRPKALVPVAGRPMIEHIVAGLVAAEIEQICLVVGYRGDQVVEEIGDGRRLGACIQYRWQQDCGGTGDALLCAADLIGEKPFFLGWGDILVPPRNYRAIAEIARTEQPEALLSVNYVDDPWEGAAVYVADGSVERITEKPPRGSSATNFNNAGLFVFGPQIMDIVRDTPLSPRGELEVPSAIQAMLESGVRIRAYEIEGYWSDVARASEALRVGAEIITARSRSGVIVHPEASVSPSARLHAPVLIAEGASVGAAELGPNVFLMAGSSVGAGARLAHVGVYPGASVGRECRLSHAIVEEDTAVADGTVVNGSPSEVAVLE
jgi:NDP-sugar pyrophosphorylase family protein